MSIVSNIIYAITDIHRRFSSNTISGCAKCFAQIEMFLIQCCNSTVSLNRNVFDTMLQFNGLAGLPSYL